LCHGEHVIVGWRKKGVPACTRDLRGVGIVDGGSRREKYVSLAKGKGLKKWVSPKPGTGRIHHQRRDTIQLVDGGYRDVEGCRRWGVRGGKE